MLLVDDDQTQVCKGREDRQTGAEHDLGSSCLCAQPALRSGYPAAPAMHEFNPGSGKALPELLFQLRGEVNFGYQHQYLASGAKRMGRDLHIDLGLAAAGDALQQKGGRVAIDCPVHRLDSDCLFTGQGMMFNELPGPDRCAVGTLCVCCNRCTRCNCGTWPAAADAHGLAGFESRW